MTLNDYTNKTILSLKNKIKNRINHNDIECAISLISLCAEIEYEFNQYYCDDELEQYMSQISDLYAVPSEEKLNSDTVLFYDGFGFDTRGLAYIYLKALQKLHKKIVYVCNDRAKGKIKLLLDLLQNDTVVYFKDEMHVAKINFIHDMIKKHKPSALFFYSRPNDVSGAVAFMSEGRGAKKFLINLTDHAFWVGKNVFDKIIEFRDYGAYISSHYRGINKDKIEKVLFYPIIDRNKTFEGFPFKKNENAIVIFSGGALYKTIDEFGTFYSIVEECLSFDKNVYFWYAGNGNDKYLKELQKRYPTRVIHTNERKDLFQVLQNVDIYLNTYPLVGGLMMQYSAAAGKPPITLKHYEDGSGFLMGQSDLNIEFSNKSDLLQEIKKLISDKAYRIQCSNRAREAVPNEEMFEHQIERLLDGDNGVNSINYLPVDIESIQNDYYNRFNFYKVHYIIAKKRYVSIMKFYPVFFMYHAMLKVLKIGK